MPFYANNMIKFSTNAISATTVKTLHAQQDFERFLKELLKIKTSEIESLILKGLVYGSAVPKMSSYENLHRKLPKYSRLSPQEKAILDAYFQKAFGQTSKPSKQQPKRRGASHMRTRHTTYVPTSGTRVARLTNINNQEFIKSETPYCVPFQADLKASVSPKKRAWIPGDQYWLVAYDQLKFLLELCRKHFDDVLLFGFPEEVTGRDNYFGVLYLLPTAPENVVKAAYRALASTYHPDNKQTGDNEKMIALNQAFAQCLKCVKEKTTDWSF